MASSKLWRVTAKKSMGKLPAGSSVEIIISGRSSKPIEKELLKALEDKYGADLSKYARGHYSSFDFVEL